MKQTPSMGKSIPRQIQAWHGHGKPTYPIRLGAVLLLQQMAPNWWFKRRQMQFIDQQIQVSHGHR
jgi:hypothetical protein